jgi:hypothetical protein
MGDGPDNMGQVLFDLPFRDAGQLSQLPGGPAGSGDQLPDLLPRSLL